MVATTSYLSHANSRIVPLDEMERIPAPEGTCTWRPVQHRQVVDAIHSVARSKGLSIASEEYSITRDDRRMFGILRLEKSGSPEWSRCVGIRNGNDKTLALGVAIGIQVHVCDNMCFSGERVFHRRHTARFELDAVVSNAFSGIESQFDIFESRLAGLKTLSISPDDASILIVRVAEAGGIRSTDILTVLKEFRNPRHEEFKPQTRWSLLNAFTEIAKKYRDNRYRSCQKALAAAFSLN